MLYLSMFSYALAAAPASGQRYHHALLNDDLHPDA